MEQLRWSDVEKAFSRAFFFSFSKVKLALACSGLLLCGLFMVFFRAAAHQTGEWLSMSFLFLPFLLSFSVLLALGVFLVRLHYRGVKRQEMDLKKLLSSSSELLIGTAQFAIFPILAYLLLWVVLGFFFLIKETPHLGDFFSVILAFGPFLLIFGTLLLCVMSIGFLFFAAPAAALQSLQKGALIKKVLAMLADHPLRATLLLLIGLLFPGILIALLSIAASWTNLNFVIAERSLAVAMEWFFMMLPFCAILSPAVVFFFNFAAESYVLLKPSSSESKRHSKES